MSWERGVEEFQFTYNRKGDLKETRWLENDLLKGLITYEYDQEGKLTQIRKDVNQGSGQDQVVRLYKYEFFDE